MKNLFILSEEEKNRILNLHESATKRHYLNEQLLDLGQSETQPTEPTTGPQRLEDTSGTIVKQGLGGDPYVYAKFGNNYYYAMASEGENPNWITAKTEKSIKAIKGKIFNEKLPKVKTIKPPKKDEVKKKTDDMVKNSKVILSKDINPSFKSIINTNKLSTSQPVEICKAGQEHCATFVNDFDDTRKEIGNAWTAHDVPSIGNMVWSSFTKLNSDQIDDVTDLWKKINKAGGPKDPKGPFTDEVSNLVNSIVPNTPGSSLKLNDVVGLYYPGSKHHEKAFYDAGKKWFRKNILGITVNGETIKRGVGWGMNTHIGIVGAIKDGVPIVFHNIGGQVWADPYNNLHGGAKIAWIKRK
jgi:hypothetical protein